MHTIIESIHKIIIRDPEQQPVSQEDHDLVQFLISTFHEQEHAYQNKLKKWGAPQNDKPNKLKNGARPKHIYQVGHGAPKQIYQVGHGAPKQIYQVGHAP